ncbi:MAG: hypothetical protein A2014_07290 [Spirochaetes bacterium GWF1_49_6]|nr:MAG: hypothetical protein A2014_07290 [Spirochaetes bacterium GWF1_49_6]
MPKEVAHWTFAKKALDCLKSESPLRRLIDEHKFLYYTAALAPDSPYYYTSGYRWKAYRLAGSRIHNSKDSYQVLRNLLGAYRDRNYPAVWVFLAGVLSHFMCDAVFHPFVIHFSGDSADKKGRVYIDTIYRHSTIETMMDMYYWDEEPLPGGRFFRDYVSQVELPFGEFAELLKILYARGQSLDNRIIMNYMNKHSRTQAMFQKKWPHVMLRSLDLATGRSLRHFMALFYPLKHPKPSELFRYPVAFRHPLTGERQVSSIRELEKEAVDSTVEWFRKIDAFWDTPDLWTIFDHEIGPNLKTGVPDSIGEDMRFFNTEVSVWNIIKQPAGPFNYI